MFSSSPTCLLLTQHLDRQGPPKRCLEVSLISFPHTSPGYRSHVFKRPACNNYAFPPTTAPISGVHSVSIRLLFADFLHVSFTTESARSAPSFTAQIPQSPLRVLSAN